MVAIEDPDFGLQFGVEHDLDRTIDAERAWVEVREREPMLTAALVQHEGRKRRAREEACVEYGRVERVPDELVAALGG